jgi:hypothetical protein
MIFLLAVFLILLLTPAPRRCLAGHFHLAGSKAA